MQENAGYTLNMAVTESLEHQAIVPQGQANDVVVAGTLNSEKCDENVRL